MRVVFKPAITFVVIGAALLALWPLVFPAGMAMANGPTPTPAPGQATAPRCRLELGADCEFARPDDVTAGALNAFIKQTNPLVGVRDVPTYTLVSATFAGPMAADTLKADTFYVEQGHTRVRGRVDYISVNNMVIFYPGAPLLPHTTYTATVTAGARDATGYALPDDFSWTFTTFSGPVVFGQDLGAANIPLGGMTIYFGDLHTHSGYVDDNYLPGTPAQAFVVGRANGLEFMALTGHDTHLNQTRWQEILTRANAATVAGAFIGLRGFEFTHSAGHLNVLNTDTFVVWTDERYRELVDFYAWLAAQPAAIGQFNHPLPDFNFYNFAYDGVVDHQITLREILRADQSLLSLNQGWHVGNLLNSDTHVADWGSQKFMGLLASSLTEAAILEAARARRTFYVSPHGQSMALVMQANGYWMGSAVPDPATLNFTVYVYDPQAAGEPLRLAVYDNGVRLVGASLPTYPGTSLYTWTPSLPAYLGHYYYAEAYYDGWTYPAYSSPVWVERSPVARAGSAQTVPPGATVSLNAGGSWDADGDALVYEWVQESGPPVSLSQHHAAQVTFVAPGTLGEAVFRVRATDTGSLSDEDTTSVTITDLPILTLTKRGPETANPGELIAYTLTVTNSGITPATGVVITDAIPVGANYVSGGTLMPGNIVSWTVPSLAANGGVTEVNFEVTTTGSIANVAYRVSCAQGVSALGSVPVLTNWKKYYLPVVAKE
ncbi:MAG: Ig-like domain-containing protein [Anaerolineae bacterium]|nr:Ig-like domain-containing protein [Anaerolineae bacterium]